MRSKILKLRTSVAALLIVMVVGAVADSASSATAAATPATSVLIPSAGATLSGTTTLDASASNATSVEFWIFGGSYGFSGKLIGTATPTLYGWLSSWNTTTVPNASYALVSEALNTDGSTFSSPVSITVSNPTTSVLIPSAGATLLSGTTTLDASASNATSVEFWILGGSYGSSGKLIGTATPTLYGWLSSWDTTTVPNASYALVSEALSAGGSTFSAPIGITVANISPGPPFTYTTFAGAGVTMTPWVGRNVALLTPVGESLDPTIMSKIVAALDAAWDYDASITGQRPAPFFQYERRDTIAVVPTSCGTACSFLGETGTEIDPSYFQTAVYNDVQNNNQYDQALFYEFGRSFWFYGSQLSPNDTYGSTATTGFAVLMRFQSMDAIGVQGGPYNGIPFTTFQAQVWGIAQYYDGDLSKTFANTLAVGQSPSLYEGTDFYASILHLLATHYGGDCFIQHFLTTVASEPSATNDYAAVTNLITAASQVANVDLRPFFYDYWSFPQPNGTKNPRAAGGIAALPSPSPVAVCAS